MNNALSRSARFRNQKLVFFPVQERAVTIYLDVLAKVAPTRANRKVCYLDV